MNKTSALTLPHPGRHSPQAHPGHPPHLHIVSTATIKPAPQSQPLPRSAFSAHGIWSPGVRLMRNVNFATKALLISLLFALPLAWVSYAYFKATNEALAFAEKERLGADYLRDIYPVLEAAQQLRREATAGPQASATQGEARDRLRAAQAKLAATDSRLGATLETRTAYAAVSQALADADKASGVEAAFEAHTRHVEALMALIAGVADASGLTLDPELETYYLMAAAVERLPDVVENTAKLGGLGSAILRSGSITPVQQRKLSEFIPIAEFQERNMREGLAKAFLASPALKDKVDAGATLADSEAFFALARKSVIEAQDFANPEAPAALLAARNKAVASQYALAQRIMAELDRLLEQREKNMRAQERTIIAVQVVTLALALYFFYSFFLVTRGGLAVITKHLQEMATGDLRNAPYKPWGRDEPAAVITDLRQTYDALHTLIHKVRHSAGALHEASGEISSASADLGARTEQAAAALEEQASAMEEIGTTVGGTAQSAQQAAAFAVKNSQVAEEGGQVFTEVVTTMHGIRQSSSKIGDIISVIDGIAFQTNILALNAAVEAARAGEQGRGFAVVAAEVRTLAQRSAEAAKEIKELITDSVQRVSVGTQVVEAASQSMQDVVSNAQKINTLLGEIASSSQQQASGVEQVVKSVQDLDRNTQQNAALVEETSAAAAALNQQATLLQEELAKFQTA